jgi:hypothetical protein
LNRKSADSSALLHRLHSFPTKKPMRLDLNLGGFE